VLISDRLRSIREERIFRKGTLRSAQACSAATSRGLRTAIRFQLLRPLKKFATSFRGAYLPTLL